MHIDPAPLELDEDGIPRSSAYGDVYHTRSGGLGQARHVFLGGNGLPGRWQQRERFTLLETGFGLGLNFLATWQAWRADPARCATLHFISTELHPFRAEDLQRLHAAWPELAELSAELLAQWPALVAGFHRLHLDGGRVQLTLLFGDANATLPRLRAAADAFYLDGFSPACNPALWQPRILHLLAHLGAPGATLATWSVAASLREGLRRAGFEWEKRPGYSGKRDMLHARLRAPGKSLPAAATRHALVIGAGVAGCSLAERLCARGWRVEVFEAADAPAQGASGNVAGVLRPLPSLDDNRLARITRAGALYARRHLEGLERRGHPARWGATGVLHLARDAEQEGKQAQVVAAHQPPADVLQFADRALASQLAGYPLPSGGWWFPGGGWVQPPSLCRANLAACGEALRLHLGCAVARIARVEGDWVVYDSNGQELARAPVLVIANGAAATQLVSPRQLPVRSARGQVSHLPAAAGDSLPRLVVCRNGYLTPAVDGIQCFGATFQVDDPDTALRVADHAENLAKLADILPPHAAGLDPQALGGRTGFRPASPDRLPMVGQLAELAEGEVRTPLHKLPRVPGLYALTGFGARGLVWAGLMAELLASQLHGDPLPLDADLVDALDPARFLLRPPRALAEED